MTEAIVPTATTLADLIVQLSAARTDLGAQLSNHPYPQRYLLGSAVDALKSAIKIIDHVIKIIDHVEYDCGSRGRS